MQATSRLLLATLCLLGPATSLAQQNPLTLPEASPDATVTQAVGITEIKVTYNRPAVGGRAVWGALVPYGEVWRAGANENTTVTFTTPVKVNKKALPAGTYGLHMIPTAKDWTVIFSKLSVGWGSFGYDPKEDALRVTVTPQPSEAFEERLSYRFDDPSETGATLALRWEKLKVPLALEVDTAAEVMASMRSQLRGAAQFNSQAWSQAAKYWVEHGGNLDEATRMSDRALSTNQSYQTLSTRALIAEKRKDAKLAAELRARALAKATEVDINLMGYGLLGEKKFDEAIALFKRNAETYPASWNAQDSLAEAYATKGDKKTALEHYARALSMVKDPGQKARLEATVARLKKE